MWGTKQGTCKKGPRRLLDGSPGIEPGPVQWIHTTYPSVPPELYIACCKPCMYHLLQSEWRSISPVAPQISIVRGSCCSMRWQKCAGKSCAGKSCCCNWQKLRWQKCGSRRERTTGRRSTKRGRRRGVSITKMRSSQDRGGEMQEQHPPEFLIMLSKRDLRHISQMVL